MTNIPNEKVYLTTEEELEILDNLLSECPYCGPDGTYYTQGVEGIICPYCRGKHYLIEKD